MSVEWFEERREGDDVVVTCSAHFVWAIFRDERVRATERQHLEELARRDERPIAIDFEVPAAPMMRGPRPPQEELFGFTLSLEQFEKLRRPADARARDAHSGSALRRRLA